jgi:SsrA-binding protein
LAKNQVQGTTIVILAIEEVRGRFKIKIALARGKKNYDKRQTIKERELNREIKQC